MEDSPAAYCPASALLKMWPSKPSSGRAAAACSKRVPRVAAVGFAVAAECVFASAGLGTATHVHSDAEEHKDSCAPFGSRSRIYPALLLRFWSRQPSFDSLTFQFSPLAVSALPPSLPPSLPPPLPPSLLSSLPPSLFQCSLLSRPPTLH